MRFDRLLFATALCTVAVSGVMAAEVDYAPENSDLILRVDGAKIARGKAWADFKASKEFAKCEQDMHDLLAKSGVTVDDILKSVVCAFADTRNDGPNIDLVVGNPKIASGTALAWLDSEQNGTAEKTLIDGKEARVVRNGSRVWTAIALEGDLCQMSLHSAPAKALTRRPGNALAGAVDMGAAVSLAYKGSPASYEALNRTLPQIAPFLIGMDTATASLNENDGAIRLDAELRFQDEQNAQNIESQLNMLLVVGMMSWQKKEPEKVDVLQRFRITRRDKSVLVNFDCPAALLKTAFAD